MEKQMTHLGIMRSKECKECNCFEDCSKYSNMKKYIVVKDMECSCEIKKIK